jgi:hypothetical protein
VDKIQKVADANVAVQQIAFRWFHPTLPILLRQFVDPRERRRVEAKLEQCFRRRAGHRGIVGFDDLLQDFALGIHRGSLAHPISLPQLDAEGQETRVAATNSWFPTTIRRVRFCWTSLLHLGQNPLMSECTIIVRDASRAIHSQLHASYVDWFVAALADDPETIEELDFALRRFLPEHSHESFFRRWRQGADAEPWDAGLCAIDLPGRLIAWESTYDCVARSGGVAAKNRDGKPDVVPFHLAEDWHISSQIDHWQANADDRRAKRIPRFDIRPVLYDGVCEFIARATAAISNRPPAADRESYPLIAAIHERWLMEPREDLNGRAPRDVMLADREHLSWQDQDRSMWWSTMGKCPPALPRDSAAYRLGSFGTDEVVLYYELVRFLATESWDQVVPAGAASEEVIVAETRRLMQLRDEWLATVDFNFGSKPPAAIIELERRRIPNAMTREESIVDHDCPLCQMAADSFSPMFSHLDGCNFDEGFAFSMFRTREEWEEQEREYAEMSRRMDERRANEAPPQTDEACGRLELIRMAPVDRRGLLAQPQ